MTNRLLPFQYNELRTASSHPPLPRSEFLYTSNHTITLDNQLTTEICQIRPCGRQVLYFFFCVTFIYLDTMILTLFLNCRYQASPPPPLLLDTDITRGWLLSGERYAEYNHRHTYKFTIWCGLTRAREWVSEWGASVRRRELYEIR